MKRKLFAATMALMMLGSTVSVFAEDFSYPMDGEELTLTCYLPGQVTAAGYENMGDTEYNKELEKQTGIHVEYKHQNGDYDEWMNLLFADADYDDIIQHWWENYPGGIEAAYNDGIIIELNDIIDQYMPNFKAFLEANPDIARMIRNDQGVYYKVPSANEASSAGYGLTIRQDWLDELGIEMPTTIDEWHDALVKIRDEKGITPLRADKNILSHGAFLNAYAPAVSNAYGCAVDSETGKVVYTPVTDAYKEYIKLLAQWYEEGLLDKDIATLDSEITRARMLNDEAAMILVFSGDLDSMNQNGREANAEFSVTPVGDVAKDENSEILYSEPVSPVNSLGACITTSCEDIETAARYLDYFWTEEGILLTNFGIEGVTYTLEDGNPIFTDEILNNEMGVDSALGKYARAYSAFPGLQIKEQEKQRFVTEEAASSMEVWGIEGKDAYDIPLAITYNEEESDVLLRTTADITSYKDEMIMKFVIGSADIDTEWDAYVETLESFGLQDMVDAIGSAYDRYINN